MSCKSPLYFIRSPNSVNPKTGKPVAKCLGNFLKASASGYDLSSPLVSKVPCGQCLDCRLAKSRDWATRCVLESLYHPEGSCFFLTLTYDEEHVPKSDCGFETLEKDRISIFMKRLRRKFQYQKEDIGIRFYGVGEYGSETFRPHYHLLLFNCKLDDLSIMKMTRDGFYLMNSPTIDSCWQDENGQPLGIVFVASFAFESAAYVARYTCGKLAKSKEDDQYLSSVGVLPEFSRMSLKPGIGSLYADDHLEAIFSKDQLVLPQQFNDSSMRPRVVKPPQYYLRKLESVDPVLFEKIKASRDAVLEVLESNEKYKSSMDESEKVYNVLTGVYTGKKVVLKNRDGL